MKELYIELDVDNFQTIQAELKQIVPAYTITNNHPISFTEPYDVVADKCPTLKEFFQQRLLLPLVEVKWYITPAGANLTIHKDGTITRPNYSYHNFGINMPVANCNGTKHIFWTTPHDNVLLPASITGPNSEFGYKYLNIDLVKDPSKAIFLDEVELTGPTIVNTAQYHSVTNPTDNTRIVIAFRWSLTDQEKDPSKYFIFDDIRK